jgi:hypothetical protein
MDDVQAKKVGRLLAVQQKKRGMAKMSHTQAVAFFQRIYGFPFWAADTATIAYEEQWSGSHLNPRPRAAACCEECASANPLSPMERNGMIAASALALAGIAYAVFATKTVATATAAPTAVASSNGTAGGGLLAIMPTPTRSVLPTVYRV